jgi:predicted nucleic acid-binding Zn ribbon protein
MKKFFMLLLIALFGLAANTPKYYCKNCGESYNSVKTLTSFKCTKHPNGRNEGYHQLYEGSEKSKYTCKYCGYEQKSLKTLTSFKCTKHPNGRNKGYHSPAI